MQYAPFLQSKDMKRVSFCLESQVRGHFYARKVFKIVELWTWGSKLGKTNVW